MEFILILIVAIGAIIIINRLQNKNVTTTEETPVPYKVEVAEVKVAEPAPATLDPLPDTITVAPVEPVNTVVVQPTPAPSPVVEEKPASVKKPAAKKKPKSTPEKSVAEVKKVAKVVTSKSTAKTKAKTSKKS